MFFKKRPLSMLVMPALLAAACALATEWVSARDKVPVVSGGVGEESVARLKTREKEYNLKLVLTLTEGNYLADVAVTVSDVAGKSLVQHVTDGPILMAQLPSGTYVINARYGGITQTRKVTLRGGRLHTEYLRWPSDPRVDFPGPLDGRKGESARSSSDTETGRASTPAVSAAGIAFVSGGIGEGAQVELLAREKEFNLKLVFTLVEGNYVAGVAVDVQDASGRTVISHVTAGPFFLARLPAGAYFMTATYDGQAQARKVTVAAGRLRTEIIRWKSNPHTDTVLPPER